MPKRRRLSLEMHVEDRTSARSLAAMVNVLMRRHPNNVGLTLAERGLIEFYESKPPVAERKRKPKLVSPVDVLAQRTLAELPQ